MSRLARSLARSSPTWSLPAPARTAVLALGAQSALALCYLWATPAGLSTPAMLAVPFVWVTVAAVAVRHARRPAGSRRVRWLAAGVGVAYALGLAWLMGGISPTTGATSGVDVALLPPGWGPALRYRGAELSLTLLPYRLVGVATLGYLLSLSVRDVAESGLSAGLGGLFALGSCAGCALPLVAAVGGALGGAGLGLGAAPTIGGGTYLVGTAAYLLAVGLFVSRPGRYIVR
ncbi:DUF7546 family protein [Halolamina salifodinae]|uniref:Uncharacterized protein n=1 Tax=Halolamina salifodinae TaxID=1202767 RepID=A0A8T4H145_9EURY|nr:hypothetical protein [Halolamina salifodinae]MBP1987048.1 hypothetical protein [Halolamina salifodinae]